MKTVFGNKQCAHVWAQQSQPSGHSQHMSFDGPTLYSYTTPIAKIYEPRPDGLADGGVVLITSRRYSATTSSKHIPACRQAVVHMCEFYVNNCVANSKREHAENLELLRVAFDKEARRMERARNDGGYCHLRRMAEAIDAYAAAFGLPSLNQVSVSTVRESEIAQTRLAAQRKRETPAYLALQARKQKIRDAKEEAERIERNRTDAEKIARWLSGESDAAPYSVQFQPAGTGALLRVAHSRVETSLGANVPLADAMYAIRFIKIVKARGVAWNENGETLPVGQFRVNHIDTNGDIKAGCHRIMFEEIERIAPMVERALCEGLVP